MAATVAISHTNVTGNKLTKVVTVTPDTSYPTGGYAITPTQVGLQTITYVDSGPVISTTNAYIAAWDYANSKLKYYWCAGAATALVEVTAATNVSAGVATIKVEGY